MHYYEVAPNQIIRAGSSVFTYSSDIPLAIGQLVQIEVGKKLLTGVVMRTSSKPGYATKSITSILTDRPIPEPLLSTYSWMSEYYSTPLATVLQTTLPRGMAKNRRARAEKPFGHQRNRTNFVFTPDQTNAIEALSAMTPGSAILHGVTGSGKTAVYIELARRAVESGTSAIILVPEIALTSQLVAEFQHHFEHILLTHSRQTEAERHEIWLRALNATTPLIVIGPRSALFLPVAHVGLIVVDECHEPSFKQDKAPRYSALRVASILGSHHSAARVIFGSATPTITDYYLAKQSDRPIVHLPTPATPDAVPSQITLVDMTKRPNFTRHRFISAQLITTIEQSLAAQQQILVFHNRRGSATTTLCESCGWQALCDKCFVPLTLHADHHHLRCHICNHTERVPTSCPVCHSVNILHKGIGTKLIATELAKLFPAARIGRYDGDSDSESTVERDYQQLYDGDIDIIVGTQVIAKGLDLPHLTTVGIIQADAGLSLPDYTSTERTFQLIAQVVGRVGRNTHATSVIVQSYQPTHPSVVDGIAQNYEAFYTAALAERRRAHFPPFVYLLKLTCIYKTEAAAVRNASALAATLRPLLPTDSELLGPTPCFYERVADTYRWQLVVKSRQRRHLQQLLAHIPSTHWQIDLDATSLL